MSGWDPFSDGSAVRYSQQSVRGLTPDSFSAAQDKDIIAAREQAETARRLIQQARRAAKLVDKHGTGFSESVFRNMMTPFGTDGAAAQQSMNAVKNTFVLDKQIEQKGPQTESDAARLAASQFSPWKEEEVNTSLLSDTVFNATLAKRKPDYMTKWAQRYGSLNALDESGRSLSQGWNQLTENARKLLEQKQSSNNGGIPPDVAAALQKYK